MKRSIRRLGFRLTYFLHGRWLPIRAVCIAIHHIARGHRISWFRDGDLWNAHLGWIWCNECADCEGADLAIWAWHFPRIDSSLEHVCKLFGGHREHRLAEGPSGEYDEEDIPIYAPIPDAWYCGRCLADDKPSDVTDAGLTSSLPAR